MYMGVQVVCTLNSKYYSRPTPLLYPTTLYILLPFTLIHFSIVHVNYIPSLYSFHKIHEQFTCTFTHSSLYLSSHKDPLSSSTDFFKTTITSYHLDMYIGTETIKERDKHACCVIRTKCTCTVYMSDIKKLIITGQTKCYRRHYD